jgi:hypothetical protein
MTTVPEKSQKVLLSLGLRESKEGTLLLMNGRLSFVELAGNVVFDEPLEAINKVTKSNRTLIVHTTKQRYKLQFMPADSKQLAGDFIGLALSSSSPNGEILRQNEASGVMEWFKLLKAAGVPVREGAFDTTEWFVTAISALTLVIIILAAGVLLFGNLTGANDSMGSASPVWVETLIEIFVMTGSLALLYKMIRKKKRK